MRLGLGLALARPRWEGLDLGLAGLGQPISSTFWSSSLGGVYFSLLSVYFCTRWVAVYFHSLFSLWRSPKVKK